jgi:hypothetical protein
MMFGILFSNNAEAKSGYKNELSCAARTAYLETEGETQSSQIATINLIKNRVANGYWGNSYCDVVKSAGEFPIPKRRQRRFRKDETYKQITTLVAKVMAGEIKDNTNNALYFHAIGIKKPKSWPQMKSAVRIGNQIFYTPAAKGAKAELIRREPKSPALKSGKRYNQKYLVHVSPKNSVNVKQLRRMASLKNAQPLRLSSR